MSTECLLVLAPITLPYEYDLSLTMTSLFFEITALLGNQKIKIVLPLCKLIDHLSKKYKERQLLFILLVICMFSSIFLINNTILKILKLKYPIFY